jgi:hypothetical protein
METLGPAALSIVSELCMGLIYSAGLPARPDEGTGLYST